MIGRPILFNADMIRAWQRGIKTQTRRVAKDFLAERYRDCKIFAQDGGGGWIGWSEGQRQAKEKKDWAEYTKKCYPRLNGPLCPYGLIGDVAWFRETHYRFGRWTVIDRYHTGKQRLGFMPHDDNVKWAADEEIPTPSNKEKPGWYKRPGIFLPHALARHKAKIVNVRLQWLQEITEEDAIAEGSQLPCAYLPKSCQQAVWAERQQFSKIWDSINGKSHPWESNPPVFALTLEPLN